VITVDCRDVEPIKNELLVYVADNIGAIPTVKLHEFDLSPINDDEQIDKKLVVMVIQEFLNSIGESTNFAVLPKGNVILLKSVTGKEIERDPPPPPLQMFSCSHCGFVTRYEVEHNNHMKIHYL
jgi:hypothetical protein